MSVNFDSWLAGSNYILPTPAETTAERAANAWRMINDNPSSVAFKKPDGTVLAAQTVRLERDNRASLAQSAAGNAPRANLIVFGVLDHPSIADTDMDEGYRFNANGDAYRIIDVIRTLGEIQGVAEAIG